MNKRKETNCYTDPPPSGLTRETRNDRGSPSDFSPASSYGQEE